MRSRNIPANSGPAVWSFIVQRADESYPLRRSPEKQAEAWASDRFQDRRGRRAGPADDPEAPGAALSHGVEGRVPENVERAVIERN